MVVGECPVCDFIHFNLFNLCLGTCSWIPESHLCSAAVGQSVLQNWLEPVVGSWFCLVILQSADKEILNSPIMLVGLTESSFSLCIFASQILHHFHLVSFHLGWLHALGRMTLSSFHNNPVSGNFLYFKTYFIRSLIRYFCFSLINICVTFLLLLLSPFKVSVL